PPWVYQMVSSDRRASCRSRRVPWIHQARTPDAITQEVPMASKSLSAAARGGSQLDILIAARDRLTDEIDICEIPKDIVAMMGQLRLICKDIETMIDRDVAESDPAEEALAAALAALEG
ncbi:hypothetical protein, partial [Segatella copri]|uniref:hypothetical protein n=2 Tax=Bacteria TaxID=2 RepID=UPI003F960A86